MSRVSRLGKVKRAKNNGGGYPADQLPGAGPRGIHVTGRPADHPCLCGGCSGKRRAA